MRIVKGVFGFGLALLATLVGLDAYLQFAQIQTPMETRIDPRLGPTYIPNKRIVRYNEGFFLGSANAYGYMGPAVPPRRLGRERRILLLGDSFILGHTVFTRQYFGRFLEAELEKATGDEVRTLNFGRADFNLWNMYQYYRDFAGGFDHDLALFFVEERDLRPTPQVTPDLYPVVRLEAGSLVIDRSFPASRTYRLYKALEPFLTRSAVLRLGFNAYKMLPDGDLLRVVLDKLAPRRDFAPAEAGAAGSSKPETLPEVSRAVLRELSRDRRNVLVVRDALPDGLKDEVLASGVPVIDLSAFLGSLKAGGLEPDAWPVTGLQGHWNHAAQPRIGRFLSDALLARGLVRPQVGLE